MYKLTTTAFAVCILASACGGDPADPHDHNENEVITTVRLAFTAGGATQEFAFDDPDGDGGAAPTIDAITLAASSTYAVTVSFENGLESPPEDITAEVREESDEHQVFFTGTAVQGPAGGDANAPLTHAYADTDGAGNPIGLENEIRTAAAGSGKLTVTLRHLPETAGVAVKVADLANTVATGGITALPGDSDASVTFDVTVQ